MQLYSNNARSTLSGSILSSDTAINVVNGAAFQSPTDGDYELLTITDGANWEVVKVTSRDGNTLTVVERGHEGDARGWPGGTLVGGRITAGTLNRFPVSIGRKDSALIDSGALAFERLSTVQTVLASKIIDLTTMADDVATITIPSGVTFFPDHVDVIITEAADIGMTTADIALGTTTGGTDILAASEVTGEAPGDRDRFSPAIVGVGNILISVKTASNSTTLTGRILIHGALIADQ